MKRIICLLLALMLTLTVLTGCEQLEGILGQLGIGGTGDQPNVEENLEGAHNYLSSMYDKLEGAHASDFDVVAQVVIKGVKYPVTWTADNSSVAIRESVKPNYYTVDLPDDNDSEINFTLTATIRSNYSDNTATKTFAIKVPAASKGNVLSIIAAIELGGAQGNSQYTTDKYYVSGTVKSITNDTYGNLYIVDADGNELLVYGTYDATGKTRFDKMSTKPQVGDTVTFYSVVGNYNGTPQLKNAWLVTLNGEELGGGSGDQGGSTATAVIDMMGSTNIQSHSAEQLIYSANGIVITNDKASSKTDCYNNTGSYAARFYGGSTLKIEYTGMTKIVLTLDDYSPDGSKNYLEGFDGMNVDGATILRNNDIVTIYFTAAVNEFHSDALASQIRVEQIEIYTGAVETPPSGGDNGGNGGSGNSGNTGSYTAPVVGQAYKFFIEQTGLNKTLYFAGTMDAEKGTYLATTENKAAAVDIYFEATNGGYHVYFMDGNTKTYINAAAYLKSNGYAGCHFELGTSPICVWTYDTTYGILEVYDEVEGKSDTFFAGTYGTYSTISLSGAFYKDQIPTGTQFPARIVLSEGGNTQPENPGTQPENPGTQPENPGTQPENPGTQPENPGTQPENPGTQPENPGTQPENPGEGNEGTDAPVVNGSASVDFSNVANRTEFTTNAQVWEQNGVKITNNKGASTSNVADYSNPARFYKNSELIIECADMVKIEFVCNSNSYASAFVDSIAAADGVSVSANGATVTVTFSSAVNSFTVVALSGGQVRMNSLTVYTGEGSGNPGTQPENPGTQPENPGTQPENPGTQPENPGEGNEGTDAPVVSGSASVDFSNVANRTELTANVQVWEQNGVKITNNKGASTSSVADYSNPARFYKNSELIIECAGMVKIEFVCNSTSYANAFVDSIAAADGVSVSANGATVTVTFSSAVSSYTVAALSGGQVRMNSLTVYTA